MAKSFGGGRSDMPGGLNIGVPAGNMGGSNVASLVPHAPTKVIGGSGGNPFLPGFPTGQSMPAPNFPANGAAAPWNPNETGALWSGSGGSSSVPGQAEGGPISSLWGPSSWENTVKGFKGEGVSTGIAQDLASFLQSGSGYNPAIVNGLIQSIFASLQPQISRGKADIMEQFGSMGAGMSSEAAIGMGDFLSQVNLNESNIASSLIYNAYNQSVQNFMQTLLGPTEAALSRPKGGGILGSISSLFGGLGGGQGISDLLGQLGITGGAAAADAADAGAAAGSTAGAGADAIGAAFV